MSGSPMPRLITSIPASRLEAILRSSSANRYGGISSRRLLGFMQLLDEFVGQDAAVHGHGPAGQVDVQILPHFDLELAPVEDHGDRRMAATEHVRDRGASRPGAAGGR